MAINAYKFVGLSNKLDREGRKSINGREPVKRAHRSEIGAILMSSKLRGEIGEGEETVGVIKALLILAMRAFNLAVMAGSIGANEFVPDSKT